MTDLPDPIVEEALRVLTQAMPSLTDEQRMEVFKRLEIDKYCDECGHLHPCYHCLREAD